MEAHCHGDDFSVSIATDENLIRDKIRRMLHIEGDDQTGKSLANYHEGTLTCKARVCVRIAFDFAIEKSGLVGADHSLFTWLKRVLFVIFILSVLLPSILAAICVFGKHVLDWIGEEDPARDEGASIPGSRIYRRRRASKHFQLQIQRGAVVLVARAGLFTLLGIILCRSIPFLKKLSINHNPLWEIFTFAAIALLLLPAMLVVAYILVRLDYKLPREAHSDYWLKGVEKSLQWVFYFGPILLMWVLRFKVHNLEQRMRDSHRLTRYHKYVTPTLATFFIGSLLGLGRHFLVSWWKAKFIYRPKFNRARILVAAFQLYFLVLLFDQLNEGQQLEMRSILLIPYSWMQNKTKESSSSVMMSSKACRRKTTSRLIQKFMLSTHVGLHDLDEVATKFINWFDLKEDEAPDDILGNFLQDAYVKRKYNISATDPISGNVLSNIVATLKLEEAEFLLEMLRLDLYNVEPTEKDNLTYADLKKWMVKPYIIDAHKSCFVFANKLNGDLSLPKALSRVILVSQVVICFVFWLFMAQLATTKVVITLGSLLVGVSFMVKDTFKIVFQGVMFAFVVHPFDVGDRVIIDQEELEVKKIEILTTAFQGPQKEITYPNSGLADKVIIKLQDEPKKDESSNRVQE